MPRRHRHRVLRSGDRQCRQVIDRQLNNPLSKTWALTFQDNIGFSEGEDVDRTYGNVLFFQPLLPVPIGKKLMFSGRPVFPLVTNPDIDVDTGETGGQTTGFGDLQLPERRRGYRWMAAAAAVVAALMSLLISGLALAADRREAELDELGVSEPTVSMAARRLDEPMFRTLLRIRRGETIDG